MIKQTLKPLKEKWSEALRLAAPLLGLVTILCFTVAPLSSGTLLCLWLGMAFVVAGVVLFMLGVQLGLAPIGEQLGAAMVHRRDLPALLILGFGLGFMVTISEPDLQVLASQVAFLPQTELILAAAAGVGILLAVALFRMVIGIALPWLLGGFYLLAFILVFTLPNGIPQAAFGAGGVVTGPMTVSFIMALGMGVQAVRNDRHAVNDSFGLVGLCSAGPVLAILFVAKFFPKVPQAAASTAVPQVDDSVSLWESFWKVLSQGMVRTAVSLAPIVLFFWLFQVFVLHLSRNSVARIAVGLGYTYLGLVLFSTGMSAGLWPAASLLGERLSHLSGSWVIVPVGAGIGFLTARTEPAVRLLHQQVEMLTDKALSARSMDWSLSVGMAFAMGLALLQIKSGVSVLWFLVPCYVVALVLSWFTPKFFIALAFDAGSAVSGPMTAAFLLPFVQGSCFAGQEGALEAFGVVAMVAAAPLITVQVWGICNRQAQRRRVKEKFPTVLSQQLGPLPVQAFAQLPENEIVKL